MEHDATLWGPKVRLAPLRVEHVTEEYVAWLNDPLVTAHTEITPGSQTLESARAYLQRTLVSPNALIWRILTMDGVHIGNIRLSDINLDHSRAWVALIIGRRESWGKGLGPEAIRLVCDHAEVQLGLNKLCAGIYAVNPASLRAFEKAGFTLEATLRRHARFNGRFIDVWHMAHFAECIGSP